MSGTAAAVLALLERGPRSGQDLAAVLGVSRAAVWKAIEALRAEGVRVGSTPGRGYSLDDPAGFGPLTLSWRCRREVEFHVTCPSTNRLAFQRAEGGAPAGTLVVADAQTAGRGRLGREWWSPKGVNLLVSLVLRPDLPPTSAPLACLAAAVAVHDVLGPPFGIKWPNDVLLPGPGSRLRKVAGILAELKADLDRLHFVVLGVGVNVNAVEVPAHLAGGVACLAEVRGPQDRAALLGALVRAIEARVNALETPAGRADVLTAWRAASLTLGRTVEVAGVRGVAFDLRDDGALLLHTPHGPRAVTAGDVSLV